MSVAVLALSSAELEGVLRRQLSNPGDGRFLLRLHSCTLNGEQCIRVLEGAEIE